MLIIAPRFLSLSRERPFTRMGLDSEPSPFLCRACDSFRNESQLLSPLLVILEANYLPNPKTMPLLGEDSKYGISGGNVKLQSLTAPL